MNARRPFLPTLPWIEERHARCGDIAGIARHQCETAADRGCCDQRID